MNSSLHIFLQLDEAQTNRLVALQSAFAEVCNALAKVVQETRCWNRVGLHHLTYRSLRERFPQMGSQMVCNAIYSVSRTCRLVLQHPKSPWNLQGLANGSLPLLKFAPTSPVYFDRHTLSLKGGELSMYTLDGRIRFQINLGPEDEGRFMAGKLREVMLSRTAQGFGLSFVFADPGGDGEAEAAAQAPDPEWPEYVLVVPAGAQEAVPVVPPEPVAV